jgi:hypothetical protein
MNFTSDDILGIAQALSTGDDSFAPSNLVSYGATVIVKPGATTRKGRPVTGHEVATRLGATYGVFPMAVEYDVARPTTMDSDDAAIGALERELVAVTEEELGAMDADLFGAEGAPVVLSRRANRLRRRYTRVLARWRKNATLALISGKKYRKKRSERQFKRLEKIWSKMGSKGIPTEGLIAPKKALRQVVFSSTAAGQSQRLPAASSQRTMYQQPVQQQSQRPPGGADHPLYFEDQRRENLQAQAISDNLMSDYMGADPHEYQDAQDDLSADIRAETVGYLFGMVEHDYWGDVSEEVQILSSDPEDEEVLDTQLAEEEADAAEDEESLDEPGQGELPPDAAPAPPTAGQADADAEVDQLLNETDSLLTEAGAGDDLDTEDDEEDLEDAEAEAPGGPTDEDVQKLVAVTEQLIAVPLTAAQASATARKRARMNKLLAQLKATQAKQASAIQSGKVSKAGRTARKQARLNKRILSLEKSLRETDSAVSQASESGSVNYGRLKPVRAGAQKLAKKHGRKAAPVVVAIRKKKAVAHKKHRAVVKHARMGGIASQGSLLDVFATEMAVYESAPTHYEVPQGYSALMAAYMLDQATEPQDYYGDEEDEWGITRGGKRRSARRGKRRSRRGARREARRQPQSDYAAKAGKYLPPTGTATSTGSKKRTANQKAYRVARKAYREAFRTGRTAELPALATAMHTAWANIKSPQRRAQMKSPEALLSKFPTSGSSGGSSNALAVFGARMEDHGLDEDYGRVTGDAFRAKMRGFTNDRLRKVITNPKRGVKSKHFARALLAKRGAKMGAYGADQFPFGVDAPFPPPRTEGEEVFA